MGLIVEICVNLGLIVIICKLTAFTGVLPDTRVAVPHPDGIGIAYNGPVSVVAGIVGRVQRLVVRVPAYRALADLLGQRGVVFGVVHTLAWAGCCIAHGPAAGLLGTGRSGRGVGRRGLDGLDVLVHILDARLIIPHDFGVGGHLSGQHLHGLIFIRTFKHPILHRVPVDVQPQGGHTGHTTARQHLYHWGERAAAGRHLGSHGHINCAAVAAHAQRRVVDIVPVFFIHPQVDIRAGGQCPGLPALVQGHGQHRERIVVLHKMHRLHNVPPVKIRPRRLDKRFCGWAVIGYRHLKTPHCIILPLTST